MGKQKKSIYTTNKCICVLLVLVAAAVAVTCVIVFTDEELRTKRQYDPSDLEWWKKSIVYQIYPRSFKDSNNDGIGDIKGITEKLDYFTDIGVDAIWISPFYKSPMRDFGYDVENYTEIDPMFGTMGDFDELMKQANKKGIKVILDFVPNHTSNESMWFKESRKMNPDYKDYYIWTDGEKTEHPGQYRVPNNWISVFGGSAWEFDSEYRYQYYYHAFLTSQPDLNFRNPKVKTELKNALKFWLDKGVAGFRVDAFKFAYEVKNLTFNEDLPAVGPGEKSVWTDFQPHNYTTNLPELYDIIRSWRTMFEEYKAKDDMSRFMSTESYGLTIPMRNEYYKAGSVPFNFDLITELNKQCDGNCLKRIIQNALKDLPSDAWPNFVMGNHDRSRVATRMGTEMIDAMNMLLLTLPGTPTCYYGDEIGMEDVYYTFDETKDPYGIYYGPTQYVKYSRDPERSPMQWENSNNAGFTGGKPWLHVNPYYATTNVKVEKNSNTNTHLKVFQKVAEVRKLPSFQNPDIDFALTNREYLSYVRTAEGRPKYLVILNVNPTDKIGSVGDFSASPVSSTNGEVVAMTGTVDIPFGSLVDLTEIKLQRGQGLIVKVKH